MLKYDQPDSSPRWSSGLRMTREVIFEMDSSMFCALDFRFNFIVDQQKSKKYLYVIVGALVIIGLGILLLNDQNDEIAPTEKIASPEGGVKKSSQQKKEELFDITKVKVLHHTDTSTDPEMIIPIYVSADKKWNGEPRSSRTFEVNLANNKLSPSKITAYQGDLVTIKALAVDHDYDFNFGLVNYRSETITQGKRVPNQFELPETPGVYPIDCSSCNNGKGAKLGDIYIVPTPAPKK